MTSVTISQARQGLSDIFDKVAFGRERIVVERRGKQRVAIVPIEDMEALEALEDKLDLELAVKALEEPGESVTLDELKAELGL
ncbi:MAG: type II toxin-antitoxin system Phd/YefM family antitoxin [Planctomycetes bacterium]|nr:type II toxin-antitoxin system Phd/YefM family antitoxin [Planctomycetota bacterium]